MELQRLERQAQIGTDAPKAKDAQKGGGAKGAFEAIPPVAQNLRP